MEYKSQQKLKFAADTLVHVTVFINFTCSFLLLNNLKLRLLLACKKSPALNCENLLHLL